ncbi:MAG: 16S rRNA (adenine(1518)-N(6)/adenine(1519)-N(6))-dimethyltransferase RsmA [Myxococcota bacterium]
MSCSDHPKAQLQKQNLQPRRQLGQNFLLDDGVLYRTAQAVSQNSNNTVLEWGPGLGALTHYLLECGLQVHAVERDERLLPLLQKRFSSAIKQQQLHLHCGDARTFNIVALAQQHPTHRVTLCGNLPYNIASRLLVRTAQHHQHVQAAFYLVQKEVGQRVCAQEGNKTYGLLSVLVQVHGQARLLYSVPSVAFWPTPKVDAALIQWLPYPTQQQPNIQHSFFKTCIQTAFSARRKKLANTLASFPHIKKALNTLGLEPNVRAEQVCVQDFVRLHQILQAPTPIKSQ